MIEGCAAYDLVSQRHEVVNIFSVTQSAPHDGSNGTADNVYDYEHACLAGADNTEVWPTKPVRNHHRPTRAQRHY